MCYVWQMIAGPICCYLNNPLLAYWFPQSDEFYITASNFIRNNEPRLPTDHQTALIPWVPSVVIKHYVLGKEVLFCRQDNYIDLYRYLDDSLALYLTLSLCCTISDDFEDQCPEHYTYLESDCQPHTVFIHREHMDWGPTDQPWHLYEGFTIPSFTTHYPDGPSWCIRPCGWMHFPSPTRLCYLSGSPCFMGRIWQPMHNIRTPNGSPWHPYS